MSQETNKNQSEPKTVAKENFASEFIQMISTKKSPPPLNSELIIFP